MYKIFLGRPATNQNRERNLFWELVDSPLGSQSLVSQCRLFLLQILCWPALETKENPKGIQVQGLVLTFDSLGSVCKVRTQDPENLDEEVKSLVTAWRLQEIPQCQALPKTSRLCPRARLATSSSTSSPTNRFLVGTESPTVTSWAFGPPGNPRTGL